MFPFRYSSIFRSRWIALLWAAGMCWMAVEVAGANSDEQGAQPENGQAEAPANADIQALEQSLRDI